jgi:hypothetical protein
MTCPVREEEGETACVFVRVFVSEGEEMNECNVCMCAFASLSFFLPFLFLLK